MPQTRVVQLIDNEYAIISVKEDEEQDVPPYRLLFDEALAEIERDEFVESGHGLIEELVRPVVYSCLKEHGLTMTELKIVPGGRLSD